MRPSKESCSHVELVTRFAALEAHFKAFEILMDERDRRYTQRSSAQDEAVKAALATSKEAVTKAEIATEKRFEGVNEFRSALSDQSATLLPRNEYLVQHDSLVKTLEELKQWRIGMETKIAARILTDLPRSEFEIYRQATDKILQTNQGRSQGVGLIGSLIFGSVIVLSYIVTIAFTLWKH